MNGNLGEETVCLSTDSVASMLSVVGSKRATLEVASAVRGWCLLRLCSESLWRVHTRAQIGTCSVAFSFGSW